MGHCKHFEKKRTEKRKHSIEMNNRKQVRDRCVQGKLQWKQYDEVQCGSLRLLLFHSLLSLHNSTIC